MNGPLSDSHSFEFDDALVYLGTRPVYGGSQKFSLSRVDRRQHLYCIGKTGTGKSTLLRNLILQDMYADCGVGVIDPHGDLARDLLDHVPSWRTNHVIYFNPADLHHPVGLNLLANVPRDRRHRVASGVVGAMKAIWAESWVLRRRGEAFPCGDERNTRPLFAAAWRHTWATSRVTTLRHSLMIPVIRCLIAATWGWNSP